jgi:hypothetical protein
MRKKDYRFFILLWAIAGVFCFNIETYSQSTAGCADGCKPSPTSGSSAPLPPRPKSTPTSPNERGAIVMRDSNSSNVNSSTKIIQNARDFVSKGDQQYSVARIATNRYKTQSVAEGDEQKQLIRKDQLIEMNFENECCALSASK